MNHLQSIRILLVEDSEEDALLLAAHLKAQGLICDLTRVEDRAALRTALTLPVWDILLADFNLPTMQGLEVIAEAARLAPGLPCILVSGQIGEEAAVEALRAGAKDFVSKSRLARLLPAIHREIAEARARAQAQTTSEALRGTEVRLHAIASAALDGIVMVDPEGKVSFWNRAAERIFGFSEAEAMGADLHALIAPARFHETFRQGFAAFQTTGQGERIGRIFELQALRKDGSECPVEVSLAAMRVGEAWHAIGVVRDATARKALEAEQLEHLQFQRTLIESLPSPFYYEDVQGRVLGCNAALQAFLGLPSQAILGRRLRELLPEGDGRGPGTGLELLSLPGRQEGSVRLAAPGQPTRHSVFHKAPFFHANGDLAGHVATLLDITPLKAAEEALQRNESLFSVIHRHVVDLVAIIDGNGQRLYTSPSYQFVLGYSEQEMAALSSTDLLHAEDLERVSQALSSLMAGRPTQRLEYRLRHKDGRWLHFESTVAIIPEAGEGPVRALVVARDVTERKASERNQAAMEVQLRQAQKLEAIGQLAAGIAHEINTPTQFIGDNTTFLRDAFKDTFDLLARLSGHLVALAEGPGPGSPEARLALADLEAAEVGYLREEIPRAIQQSLDGVGRISKIVKAMKDFSHPGGEEKTLTDLHQAIESTLTVSRNEWKYAANLVTDFDPQLPLVPCFPGEFNQVILNLIVNAAHAIEAAKGGRDSGLLGQITVTTRARQDEVEVSVADDGTGIPEAVQARMFEPFYTTKPVGKGSGQGLAIAHAVIVEKHQGRIEVRSAPGRGTEFILHLPLQGTGAEEGVAP